MGGPGRAQDLNYLNYLIPGPELNNLNNLNNLNIGGGGLSPIFKLFNWGRELNNLNNLGKNFRGTPLAIRDFGV